MREIAQFEKVSYEQFKKDVCDMTSLPEDIAFELGAGQISEDELDKRIDLYLKNIYDCIKLPKRATKYSAGYDFCCPFDVTVDSDPMTIPTGIRVKIDPGFMLQIVPRSGLGFKHGERLANTVGIIDGDYYNSKNEGHIMVKLSSDDVMNIDGGERFVQGIFIEYGTTKDDDCVTERDGGIGSTGK